MRPLSGQHRTSQITLEASTLDTEHSNNSSPPPLIPAVQSTASIAHPAQDLSQASQSTAQLYPPQSSPTTATGITTGNDAVHTEPSAPAPIDHLRKRRRRSSVSAAGETVASGSHSRKRARGFTQESTNPAHGTMRPDHATEPSLRTQQRPSTNGSSHNGSSPLTNGSVKSETNGYHTNGHSDNAIKVQNKEPFFGHDREEVTRILLQSLSDLGYQGAAEQLSRESGFQLEIASVAAFRTAVLSGEWEEAESLLFGTDSAELDGGGVLVGNGHAHSSWQEDSKAQNGTSRQGLPLAEGADVTMLRFCLRQQKYLELLERRELTPALIVLRSELTPLKTDVGRLHFLSRYVLAQQAGP